MKYLLEISFLGTAYFGFQVQKGKDLPTVQGTVQDAVNAVFGRRYPVTGCSRTDRGVHAKQFFVTVDPGGDRITIPTEKIPTAMNAALPDDIAVKSAVTVPDSFHPRYTEMEKEYIYVFDNGGTRSPFDAGRAYYVPRPIREDLMDEAARKIEGKHDFTSFMAAGSKIVDAVRTVKSCRVRREGDRVILTVSADGFLYNMVRIIAGTLLAVSDGRISPDEVTDIVNARDRSRAGSTLPPDGLYLNRVTYF